MVLSLGTYLQMVPISSMGCLTPISLFTVIMETNDVDGLIAASNSPRSMRPFDLTGMYVTSNPSASKALHESNTHLCS